MGGQPNPGASGEAVALSERQAAVHAHAPSVRMHPVAAWAVLVTASLGVFVGGAELMVVAIALTQIVADFGGWADLARASWIVNAYLLAYVIAMPLAGRAADIWGARRLYVAALILFSVGSLGAGLAPFAGP